MKCPNCGKVKVHNVYFNNDGRYVGVQYKYCMECDFIFPIPIKDKKKE
ncbi:MAG: hypothetical protein ACOCP8_03690 [archaeon]